jgi:hypothetical protein
MRFAKHVVAIVEFHQQACGKQLLATVDAVQSDARRDRQRR